MENERAMNIAVGCVMASELNADEKNEVINALRDIEVKFEGDESFNLNTFAIDVHQNAIDHGWWETERSFGEIIALCHSELSEALEEHRHNRPILYTACKMEDLKANGGGGCGVCAYCAANKPEGIASELADCIIRILDYCEFAGIDIEQVLKQKHEYNKTRTYRHGGKAL